MVISRRQFIEKIMFLTSSMWFSLINANSGLFNGLQVGYMPDESAPHKRTWMAFIASNEIWEQRQVPEVQRNLASIAKIIAKYEPVSMLIRSEDYALAVDLLGGLESHNYPIELIPFQLNDLWMRDTGPVFVLSGQGQKYALNLNFNGWGEDQHYHHDAKVADFVANQAGVQSIRSTLTLEGGCFEVDEAGTAIMTESCILNDNRNPKVSKAEVESELKQLLGLRKIIWLKGIKGQDITDGHTDFYARFVKPSVVLVSRDNDRSSFDYQVTRDNIEVLKRSTDANGNTLEVVILDTPWDISSRYGTNDFAAGYVGFYICNDAILLQKFGDKKTDNDAKITLQTLFPNHQIEQIAIDGIASGGGSIHCATQQEPLI